MDGLPLSVMPQTGLMGQRTLKAPIGCVGIGLHSGSRVSLKLHPAPPDHGIVFRRTDLGRDIPARFDYVADGRLATSLVHPEDSTARIGTVEHLMAALAGTGVSNVLVELDGPELPILDGSASPYVFLIDCAGIAEQEAAQNVIEIRRPVRVAERDSFVELRPPRAGFVGLEMTLSIDFAAAAIGRQSVSFHLTPTNFRHQLCRARTFALAEEVERLRAAGLARGGSLDNAVVVDQARVLNPGGLRMQDEFARHKVLDAVGDLALAGAAIHGRFIAHRSGHALNNRLLRALFADHFARREGSAELLSAAA
jgi:UDP-3-O-[3-hydroxymyristoyl] N-acetylglucosamine deacetylase